VGERVHEHGAVMASDPLRLREARRWLARLVLEAGYTQGDAHDLAVAFAEACTNVHRHAYGGRHDGRVGLHVAIDDERVVLSLDHDGDAFEPAAYAPPDLNRPAESGYGLYLIRSLVDEVSFERTPSGGRVVLVKHKQLPAVVR
jgi:serine/threonine-protein kinase RsbW